MIKITSIIIISLICLIAGCKENNQHKISNNTKLPMPEYYRKITGYDSIQLIFGGRSRYNEKKQDYDVTWDSLFANFCYPNKFELEKFKKDTPVFIPNGIYMVAKNGEIVDIPKIYQASVNIVSAIGGGKIHIKNDSTAILNDSITIIIHNQ